MSWFVKMTHFDYKDEEEYKFEKRVLKLWNFFGSIVEESIINVTEYNSNTGIQCRRRPKKQQCFGVIQSRFSPDRTELDWWCSVCGDNGHISEWKGTRWDYCKKEYNT